MNVGDEIYYKKSNEGFFRKGKIVRKLRPSDNWIVEDLGIPGVASPANEEWTISETNIIVPEVFNSPLFKALDESEKSYEKSK